ncbi:hypothetical protein V1264_016930 [Littorina saxatilis]|uniref:Immunoglobulin V-set domain-containing protein n=1 Tax=Littorina saxatilis TaxID=31220 RepID=A0AAN9BG62_9CAEN
MTRGVIFTLVLLTLLLLTFSVRSSVSMTPVTCSAPLSALGQPSHLTCFFQRDLHASNKQIMVVRHSFGAPNDDLGKDVLTCTRRVHSDALQCKAKDGYIFDGEISDRLTLQIPTATNDTAGQYLCHVIPPDGCIAYPCSLAVYENQEMFPPQSEPNQKQDTISLTTILFIINVCLVPILASCVMLIFRYRLR